MRIPRSAAILALALAGAASVGHALAPVAARSQPSAAPVRPTQPVPALSPGDAEASAELTLALRAGDTLPALLERAGVGAADSRKAGALIGDSLSAGDSVVILLGRMPGSGRQRLQKVSVRAGLELRLTVERDPSGALTLVREDILVDSTPLRVSGRAGSSLYWSLRGRGVPAETAADYVALVGSHIDIARDLKPGDRFQLVADRRRAATGETRHGPLLYAGIERPGGRDVRLVNWKVGGRQGWFDAAGGQAAPAAWTWPVHGRLSSSFGARPHPILRFVRFHRGIDLSAPMGAPVVAAADGMVTGAGWNGGYGRQVRIAHGRGIATSYAHMSAIAARPGAFVRRGAVIGYVGSSGFSTGAHLHYEVTQDGRPVDPMQARHSSDAPLSATELAAVRARARQLLGTAA